MGKIRITSIIGTRPEAIKLVPVVLAARKRPHQFQISVVRTGQHRGLVDQLMDEFGVCADHDLEVMQSNQDLSYVLTESLRGLSELFARQRPDWVLVQGDTMSTVAGALAGFYNHISVGHVEAGLRTGDRQSPFPEEVNRSIAARLTDLHFAPTEQARRNLLLESIADEDIVVTGNTVVDGLVETLRRSPSQPVFGRCRYVVLTAHRRENLGSVLHDICDGLIMLLERNPDVRAVVPMHPNPKVRDVLIRRLGGHDSIVLSEAVGYTEFVYILLISH
jgi:UDP-N-acetylglucosamine 2-epimerase (non-hydrolysing)